MSEAMKCLLLYIQHGKSTSAFTDRLEKALALMKTDAEWRKQYMTLEMKLFEEREEGRREGLEQGIEQGIEQGKRDAILELLAQNIITAETACDKLDVSSEELQRMVEEYAAR